MLFDTHCHLNFQAFEKSLHTTIESAHVVGVQNIIIPGTDVISSQKATVIATAHEGIYAAVGIHPHHVFTLNNKITEQIKEIEKFLTEKKVVAVGEVGLDRHEYEITKYQDYSVNEEFIALQKDLLIRQIGLAIEYEKSLILHNRKAVDDILDVLTKNWDEKLRGRTVLHCCEADEQLLAFAIDKGIYIGVDGDITWSKKKQRFIHTVPLEILVLETDAPYLTPEGARAKQSFPNEPKNITYVRDTVARIHGIDSSEVEKRTTENAQKLFNIKH